MVSLLAFTPGQSRRQFQNAVDTCIPLLREVADLLKWRAWGSMETGDEPDAIAALNTWQSVRAAVAALETLREMAPEWHGWASNNLPDAELYEKLLDDALDKFAPKFAEAMAGRT